MANSTENRKKFRCPSRCSGCSTLSNGCHVPSGSTFVKAGLMTEAEYQQALSEWPQRKTSRKPKKQRATRELRQAKN